MQTVLYPGREDYAALLQRPHKDAADLGSIVAGVLHDVRREGDTAVLRYEEKFDKVCLASLAVSEEEVQEAEHLISDELKQSIRLAHANIHRFHQAQRMQPVSVETAPGVHCWQKSVAIERVGLYIPGGTAPLFSTVLMLATPAKIAGCADIVLCSPPSPQGKLHPAILYAARVAGVNRIYKCGGVQAIGAMAYGTETVPKVSKIFGPGNQFVTCAKQQVSMTDVAIDMPAGPSEVAIVADATCHPRYVAADMLSQAEHGMDSQSILFTDSEQVAHDVLRELEVQLESLPRKEMAMASLRNSRIVVLRDMEEAFDICNEYAPEHLILAMDSALEWTDRVVNAGSVFLGHYSCESAGDYASGTNHTLPTSGYAKAYSGVNLDSFCRKITFQHLTPQGIQSIGRAVEVMAEAESLDAHRNAMILRMEDLSAN
ncbi:MAG: histidinol dehydrogenase [Bacteroidaceae bacterium]|nr:histidinol dehydrogenase [Bacteroidaceae bacterium]